MSTLDANWEKMLVIKTCPFSFGWIPSLHMSEAQSFRDKKQERTSTIWVWVCEAILLNACEYSS